MHMVLGIDIAKSTFDVALRHGAVVVGQGHFSNNAQGFVQLQRWLRRRQVHELHACMEATGRYGVALAKYLHHVGYTVSVVNPRRTAAYAESKLQRIKTDKTAALLLADFCATQAPEPWQPPAAQQEELQALARHLETLKQTRTRANNQLKAHPPSSLVRRQLEEQLARTNEQIRAVEQELEQLTHQDEDLQHKVDLITSIPAIGPATAAKFLAEVPTVTAFAQADHLAAYAGLTPTQRSSGETVHGKSTLSKKGNRHLRTTFYMPALCAIRLAPKGHNPPVDNLVLRLQQQGKKPMVIVGAVMRKLLHLVYGVLKTGKPFDPHYSPQGA
jgi:transposase